MKRSHHAGLLATVVSLALVAGACGHDDAASPTTAAPTTVAVTTAPEPTTTAAITTPTDGSTVSSGGTTGDTTDTAASTTELETTTTEAPPGPGDFGDMKNVCGPGTPSGSPARGVTDTEIQIGVLNDATSSLVPGLGAEYIDVANAFADWCNAAGGINGRTITFVNRDAQILQAAARIVDACQSDFMLVGGATPFDAPTVQPRVDCGLGSIPAYAASPEATAGALQALPTRIAAKQANLAVLRLLEAQYGAAFAKIGLMAVDTPSLLSPAESVQAAITKSGYTVTSFQKLPLSVDNWRTYVQPLVGSVDALSPPPADLTALFRAMGDVGYAPTVMFDATGSRYGKDTIDAINASGITVPYYTSIAAYPLEMADQNPAVAKAIELTLGANADLDPSKVPTSVWAAWLLFAQSATACGNELTVECVITNATTQTDYTAAGLIAPVDLTDPNLIGPCRVILSAHPDGWVYEKDLTAPTDGIYNCDPANVVDVG